MTTVYTIPFTSPPQIFTITLGGTLYTMTVQYRNNALGGWVIDIADQSNNPIVSGIPLVTGVNLLAQYAYLQIGGGGGIYVQTATDPDAVPTFGNLGNGAYVYWVTEP